MSSGAKEAYVSVLNQGEENLILPKEVSKNPYTFWMFARCLRFHLRLICIAKQLMDNDQRSLISRTHNTVLFL